MTDAALYECELRHVRTAPIRYSFTLRTYQWLVDVDNLPRLKPYLRPLARFEARDHFGDPNSSIRANVDSFLGTHGIDLRGGRVLMLGNARVLGRAFNTLTLFWCRYADDTAACVIAEVRNLYGGWHCYLLLPDERGHAEVDKEFYASPFFPVDGGYRVRLTEPAERLSVSIALHREGGTPFVASLRGTRRQPTTAGLIRMAVRHPWVTAMASGRIRLHGIRLVLRGLRVHHVRGRRGQRIVIDGARQERT